MLDLTQCTLVKMTNMPYSAAPAWIFTKILDRNSAVKEIEMAPGGYYCYVDTPDCAQSIVAQFDYQGVLEEYLHAYKVICVGVVPMAEAPTANTVSLRLTDFLRTEENMPHTKTVQFRGLPRKHPGHDFYPIDHANTDTNPHVVKIEACDGKALVRLSSKDAAAEMVSMYNGSFWKNDVVYAEFVADSEMDDIIQTKMPGKQTKLFIQKVKPGASKEDIRAVFAPHECQDIQMPPGQPFAFVFMYQEAAAQFSDSLDKPNGKYHNGWFWRIKSNKKKSEGNAAPAVPDSKYQPLVDEWWISKATIAFEKNIAVPKTATNASIQCDSKASEHSNGQSTPEAASKIRVTGIPRSATEEHVRKFFEGYPVKEIVLNQGIAIVAVTSQHQAEEAQLVLNNNKRHKLLGKKVICVLL
ncbi:uncharacterized protein N0V89_004522 [Didymosphaeria variabile]|uniref:RRM domain-containing protein n=1 Tax=Didymosphaeria variabile TaxID=1932322 RepID=A0A9W8XPL2_9PLEO|nr:uncharacterized protein N0V89_004522 [Didymosphaeria variabile]KAJ4356488.1 hypothetical protein N0V89_004522 [Didymosphaeria variabile]